MRNIFLVICLFSSLVFAEFDYAAYKKGNEAFKNADYKEAMQIWKSVIPTMRSKNRYPHNGIIDEYTMCAQVPKNDHTNGKILLLFNNGISVLKDCGIKGINGRASFI